MLSDKRGVVSVSYTGIISFDFLWYRANARINDSPPGVRRLMSCPGGGFISCSGLFDNGYGSMMLKVFSNFEV